MSFNNVEIESHLKKISDTLQKQSVTHNQLQGIVSNLQQQVTAYKNQAEGQTKQLDTEIKKVVESLQELSESLRPRYKDIDDIPGLRIPKWYEVDVDFEVGDTAEKIKSIQINPEGPFVVTQITPLWQVSSTNSIDYFANTIVAAGPTLADVPGGRILPNTAFPMIVRNLGITNTTSVGFNTPSLSQLCSTVSGGVGNPSSGPLRDIPEIDFQIEIGGSGRYWTNQVVPAAAFYGVMGQPLYLSVPGWVERSDRIVIHATPTVAIPHNGTVRFGLHGYQIMAHISIAEALGY